MSTARTLFPYGRNLYGQLATGILLALTACAGEPADDAPSPPPASPPAAVAADVTLPEREEFVTGGLRDVGRTRAALAVSLGQPDSVASAVVPNRHDPSVRDTLFTVYYPGLVAHVHRPGRGQDLLARVEVTDNRHLHHPLIGATRESVEAAFGPPDEEGEGTVTYYCNTCEADDNPLVLSLRDGRVARAEFNYYVD